MANPKAKTEAAGNKKAGASDADRKKSVDVKPAGKQPRKQKSETFEPGVEG